jgi:hypothetical protein
MANDLVGWIGMRIMAGKSPVVASAAQRRDLMALSHSRDRGEVDRARALPLTLAGWTSSPIAGAFGVREDTMRLRRSAFSEGGIAALGCPGTSSGQSRARSGNRRGGAVQAGGGSPQLDPAAAGRRHRETLLRTHLVLEPFRDSRRLQLLTGWSHGKANTPLYQVPTRMTRRSFKAPEM